MEELRILISEDVVIFKKNDKINKLTDLNKINLTHN